jgi:hypothetical protein
LRVLGHHVPAYLALGNHEANHQNFYDYTYYPYPESLTDHRQFGSNYSFIYGNVFVLVVDTNSAWFLMAAAGESSPLSEWIVEQVSSEESRRATWRVAMGHHPGYSECGHRGAPAVAEWFMPLLSDNNFHAYFCGHTHDYERIEVDGLVHIISGGGGASLYTDCQYQPPADLVAADYHYVLVDADCDRMTLTAFHVPDATVIDEVTIVASP